MSTASSSREIFTLKQAVGELPLAQPLCIEASAGTGKTWTIERLVIALVASCALPLPSILVLTFTEAATAELKERIRARLVEAQSDIEAGLALRRDLGLEGFDQSLVDMRLQAALRDFDQAGIYTIHGFCNKVLSDFSFDQGLAERKGDPGQATMENRDAVRTMVFSRLHDGSLTATEVRCMVNFFANIRTNRGEDPLETVVQAVGRVLSNAYLDPVMYSFRIETLKQAADSIPFVALADLCVQAAALASCFLQRMGCSGTIKVEPNNEAQAYLGSKTGSMIDRLDRLASCTVENWFEMVPDQDGLTKLIAALAGNKASGITNTSGLNALWGDALLADLSAAVTELLEALQAAEAACFTSDGGGAGNAWCFQRLLAWNACFELARQAQVVMDSQRRQQGLVEYDGMIDLLYQALAGKASTNGQGERLLVVLRKRYKALLVDEFQDTDAKQWAIFRMLGQIGQAKNLQTVRHSGIAGAFPLFLLGDPKQAIYSFRGADVDVYLRASGELGADRTRTLAVNFRSRNEIVQGVNAVFSNVARFLPDCFPLWSAVEASSAKHQAIVAAEQAAGHADIGGPFWHFVAMEESGSSAKRSWRQFVRTTIINLRNSWQLNDIAILTNSNNDARSMLLELRRYGIPSRIEGRGSLASSDYADHLLWFAGILSNPWDAASLRLFGLSPFGGMEATYIETQLPRLSQLVRSAHDNCERLGFMAALESVLLPREPAFLAMPGGKRALTDYRHLAELYDAWSGDEHIDTSRLQLRFQAFIDELRQREEASLRMDSEESAVKIMTIHAAKGREFPVVFLYHLPKTRNFSEKGNQPFVFSTSQQRRLDPLQHAANLPLVQAGQTRNTLCLWYVALTRAISRVYMPIPGSRPANASILMQAVLHQVSQTILGTVKAKDGSKQLMYEFEAASPFPLPYQLHALDSTLQPTESHLIELHQPAPGTTPVLAALSGQYRHLLDAPAARRFPRSSSYSGLVRGLHQSGQHGTQPARDSDPAPATPAAPATPVAPAALPNASSSSLPVGPAFGNLVHDCLESFALAELGGLLQTNPDTFDKTLRNKARSYGFASSDYQLWKSELYSMLQGVLDCELQLPNEHGIPIPHRIGNLPQEQLRTEQGFTWYIPGQGCGDRLLQGELIMNWLGAGLTNIAVPPGFLGGFIDLVIEHNGWWHVLDWKTNRLDSYGQADLQAQMEGVHLYKVQALVYMAALHKARPGKVSGASYLFTRGPAVFHMQPGQAVLDEVCRQLEAQL